MSGIRTIEDPETLRIKFSGRQILAFALGVFAIGGYFTSLHFQVAAMKDEIISLKSQVTEIRDAVDSLTFRDRLRVP